MQFKTTILRGETKDHISTNVFYYNFIDCLFNKLYAPKFFLKCHFIMFLSIQSFVVRCKVKVRNDSFWRETNSDCQNLLRNHYIGTIAFIQTLLQQDIIVELTRCNPFFFVIYLGID